MKITRSGFYQLSDFQDVDMIEISPNIKVQLFDIWSINKEIRVAENTTLTIFGLLENETDYVNLVRQTWENSKVEIKYLLLAKNTLTKAKIHSRIESNNSTSDVEIVSFAAEKGEMDIDWVIDLAAWFSDMSGHLLEENIFLWEKWKIRGLPTLLVASNEVEASHACKIHKISDEKLFYMRSRGIPKEDAIDMYLVSIIKKIFGKIQEYDEDLYDKIQKKIVEKIT